jgi:hypothetical protein
MGQYRKDPPSLRRKHSSLSNTIPSSHFFIGRPDAPPYAWNYADELTLSNRIWLTEDQIDPEQFDSLYLHEVRSRMNFREKVRGGGNARSRTKEVKRNNGHIARPTNPAVRDDHSITITLDREPSTPLRGSSLSLPAMTCPPRRPWPTEPRDSRISISVCEVFSSAVVSLETLDVDRKWKRRKQDMGARPSEIAMDGLVVNKERRGTFVSTFLALMSWRLADPVDEPTGRKGCRLCDWKSIV